MKLPVIVWEEKEIDNDKLKFQTGAILFMAGVVNLLIPGLVTFFLVFAGLYLIGRTKKVQEGLKKETIVSSERRDTL